MLQEDQDFLQLVSIVTSQFGCTIDSVDGRTISITCPTKDIEVACAQAIEEIIEGGG